MCNKKKNLVSIIMPTYNSADFIGESIRSAQAQSYENWELIIVDDCSTDDTETVVSSYQADDERIKYCKLKENSGAAVARTKAMKLAQGDYMAFLDSDDLWYPDKLNRQLEFMQKNNYAFTCTSYKQINESGESLDKVIRAIPKTNYNRLLLDCPVGNSSVMYSVRKMGKFEVPNIRKRNDDALWLQMLKKEEYIYGFDEVLMKYRIREGSISSNKLNLIKYHWKLYREIEHLSVPRSIFHICYWGILKVFNIK